jgi:hypothetical protein
MDDENSRRLDKPRGIPSGLLAPQDPNDEPAALLLARVRAVRNGQPVQASLL